MTTQYFKLQNISCSSCVMHLEAMEDDIEGIEKVDVNFKKQTMTVEYLESAISAEGIVQAVSAMGYGATAQSTVTDTKQKGSPWNRLFHS